MTFTIAGGDSGRFNVALRGGVAIVDTEPAGTDITSTFDPDANVVTRVDEAGNVFTCGFDALNRQLSCSITPAAGFLGTTSQAWFYDGLSRLVRATDNNDTGSADDVTTAYFFDSLSRQVEETQQIGMLPAQAISSNFDIATAGAVVQPSALIYPDGRQLNSYYDGLDRLVARQDNGASSPIGTYQYLGPFRVASLTFQNHTRPPGLAGISRGEC